MYFGLATKDCKSNNWILFSDSKERGATLLPQYHDLRCSGCGKLDELSAIERGIDPAVIIRSKWDIVRTEDGFLCFGEKMQKFVIENGLSGLRLLPLSGSSGYSVVLPTIFAQTDSTFSWDGISSAVSDLRKVSGNLLLAKPSVGIATKRWYPDHLPRRAD